MRAYASLRGTTNHPNGCASVPTTTSTGAYGCAFSPARYRSTTATAHALDTDRIGARATDSEFVVFGGTVLRGGTAEERARWADVHAGHRAGATRLARSL